MKRSLTTLLLLGAIATSGITACSRSNTDTPQADQPSPTEANAPQSEQRDQKRQEVRKQIEAVLTPEQAQQLKTKVQQGEKMRQALASLNLTDEQKSKIQAILKASRGQRPAQTPTTSQ